jgi:hypothetical protein
VYQGSVIGHLTKNKYVSGAVDPDLLFGAYGCLD